MEKLINIDNTEIEEKWLMAKWGMFSASEIAQLKVPGKEDKKTGHKEMFGAGAMTYIKTIARQAYTLFNRRDSVETYDMKMGKINEAQAYGHLYKLLGFDGLQYYGDSNPEFFQYCADSGASPDVLAPTPDGISFGSELKCPKGDTHFNYLSEMANQEQLQKIEPDYFGQCQFSMMTFKCDLWLWCSYNEFFPLKDRMLIIEVKRDNNWCNDMDLRLKQAVKMKYEFIQRIVNRAA